VAPLTVDRWPGRAGPTLCRVADEKTADDKTADREPSVPPKAVKAAAAFVARHGKPARAVVENIGRKGARVVLVGHDGAMGDVLVPSPALGERLIEKVRDLEAAEWDRETVEAAKIGHAHRVKMGGRARG